MFTLQLMDNEHTDFKYEKVKECIKQCIAFQENEGITMGEVTNRVVANGLTLDEYWEIYEYLEHWGYPEYKGSLKDWDAWNN